MLYPLLSMSKKFNMRKGMVATLGEREKKINELNLGADQNWI